MMKTYAFRCTNEQLNIMIELSEGNWLSRTTIYTTAMMQYMQRMVDADIIEVQEGSLEENPITDCQFVDDAELTGAIEYLDSPAEPRPARRYQSEEDEDWGLAAAEDEPPYHHREE